MILMVILSPLILNSLQHCNEVDSESGEMEGFQGLWGDVEHFLSISHSGNLKYNGQNA